MRLVRRRRWTHLHRPGSALDAALHVDAHVGGDAVQPRPDAGPALKGVGVAPGPDHRLLDGVLGLKSRTEHAVAVSGQLTPKWLQLGGRDTGSHSHVSRG